MITAAGLLANAVDPEGSPLTVINLTASSGTLTGNGVATWTFTPAANDDTSVDFDFRISDGLSSTPATATLDLTPVNDAPTGITLANTSVTENVAGAVIGTLTAQDLDAGGTHTFQVVGDTRFEVVGGNLKLRAGISLDFETQPTVALSIRATDQGGLSTTQNFTISVTDVVGLALSGTAGRNTLGGTSEADTLRGLGGDDVLRGLAGNDQLFGDAGLDRLEGGAGNDRLEGGAGRDTLRGDAGNDTLLGGSEDDALTGGVGLDRLDGGAGRDTLTGNADSDIFVFGRSYGRDTVTDFQNGTDRIDLSSTGLTFSNLVLQQAGTTVIVQLGTSTVDQLTLRGATPVTLAQIDASDFLFV
jgi:Ca2+-binding RTX toxin-like protein